MIRKPTLLIALLCGLISAVLVWFYLDSFEEQYYQKNLPVAVLVAKGDIQKGTILKERMITVIKIPREYVQPKTLTSVKELFDENGKYKYVTLLTVMENEQITQTKLSLVEEEMGLAISIQEGKTAVAIPMNEFTSLGGFLRSGNRVNVICTVDYEEKTGKHITTTFTLFQNILVLSAGKKTKESESSYEGNVITLSVTPYEAQLLTFARERSSISLALRSSADETIYNLPKVDIQDIVSGAYSLGEKIQENSFLQSVQQLQKSTKKALEKVNQK